MGLKVIGVGMSRTGTLSLKTALENLGFGPCFHGLNAFTHPEIIDLAFAASKGHTVDWSEVIDDSYKAAVDYPSAYFYEQFVQAHPEAKMILTIRDPEAWYESLDKAIMSHIRKGNPFPSLGERSDKLLHSIFTYFWNDRFHDKEQTINRYKQHNEDVIRKIPAEKLLVYNVAQGWEPLCNFLDVEVPDVSFPVINSRSDMQQKLKDVKDGIPDDLLSK